MKRLGILLAVLSVSSFLAAQSSPADSVARLEQTLSRLTTFEADFAEAVSSSSFSTPLREKGRVYFQKPDLMRWDYTGLEPKTYIYKDGVFLSYFPEDKQLWRQKIPKEQYESDILALVSGRARISERYVIEATHFPGGGPNQAQIKLTPREQGETSTIQLEIDRRSWMIGRIIIFDWSGSRTEFVFSRMKPDIVLPKDLFDLKVPPDTEIIEDEPSRKK
jgi:outer membrane lipoprotein carrier protein